jgi:hypothetical protein
MDFLGNNGNQNSASGSGQVEWKGKFFWDRKCYGLCDCFTPGAMSPHDFLLNSCEIDFTVNLTIILVQAIFIFDSGIGWYAGMTLGFHGVLLALSVVNSLILIRKIPAANIRALTLVWAVYRIPVYFKLVFLESIIIGAFGICLVVDFGRTKEFYTMSTVLLCVWSIFYYTLVYTGLRRITGCFRQRSEVLKIVEYQMLDET